MNHDIKPLWNKLSEYSKKNTVHFDVPGHKIGKGNPYLTEALGEKVLGLDVNSMPELDNLNYPAGVIKEAQEYFAHAFCADHAFFTVNGTSLAVHAMILSACGPGDKLIIPRNCHKSAINSIILSGAQPVYLQPEIHPELGIAMAASYDSVKAAIDNNPDAKAVFLINPTYYGVCSDIKAIVEYAHAKGMAVLVDEAHGTHFYFSKRFPVNAMEAGADMAAVSVHKTGGSLTQSSALLLKGDRISPMHVQNLLNILHTTSASYLLMLSLDLARSHLAVNGKNEFERVYEISRTARNKINKIEGLYAFGNELCDIPGVFNFDESKLGINVTGLGLTGFEVYDLLYKEYSIQMELADLYNVLGVVSLGDNISSTDALIYALLDIASKHEKNTKHYSFPIPLNNPQPGMTPRDAFYAKKEFVALDNAAGRIIGESVMIYPPGIPILAPGEVITKETIEYLKLLKTQHSQLTDMEDKELNNLLAVKINL